MEEKLRDLPCPQKCPFIGSDDCGSCSDTERFVRHFKYGPTDEKMTESERLYIIEDTDHCGEGAFDRKDLEKMEDDYLAEAALDAWRMYVQSNCL